jgi:response regulator RpfG family c-di-GMP phosphodiesterase
VRIRTKLLLSVCPLKGDIYIRLSEQKFVKLFHEGDTFDLSDLERYTIKKGVEYLYIRKEQCKEFTHKYRGELHRLLQADPLSIEEAGKLGNSVHETVQELSAQIGFTKEVQELTKTHVQLTVKSMGKDPNLAEILKRLKASEGQYISYHSTLVSYFACAIAAEMHWGSETTFYKLALAAFMHDITLSNQGLAQLSSLEELERDKAKYTEQELKDFRGHPIDAAEMIKRMNEIPPDVDTIVIQHHERPDGTGFPRTLAYSYIAPLASVFIVAHDLAQYVCSSRAGFDIQEFITGKKEVYKASQFKKILLCLDSLGKVQSLAETLKKLQ